MYSLKFSINLEDMMKEYPPELTTRDGESLRDMFYGLGISCEGEKIENTPPIVSKASQYLSRPVPDELFYRLVFWGKHDHPDNHALAAILISLTDNSIDISWQYLYSIFARRPVIIQSPNQPNLNCLGYDKYLIVLERQDEPAGSNIAQVIIRRTSRDGKIMKSFDIRFVAHSQTGEYLRVDPPNRKYKHIVRSIMSGRSARIYIEPTVLKL